MRGSFGRALVCGGTLLFLVLPAGTGVPVRAALSAPRDLSGAPLTSILPEGVPGPQERVGWEEVRGEIHRENDGVLYALYVNPRYGALYQITQFRIWSRRGGKLDEETEKLLWNPRPGVREPLFLYAREGNSWQRIPAGTPPYDREILHAINLYNLHRQASGVDAFPSGE
jgi:hypothetical protein